MEEVFIAYIDEKGDNKEGYFKLISNENGFVTFLTNDDNNEVSIPNHRVLKIKRKIRGVSDE